MATDTTTNPYAAPTARVREQRSESEYELASYGDRILGVLIDTIAGAILPLAVLFATVGIAGLEALEEGADPSGLVPTLVAVLVVALVQMYLLATRSQSIGKIVVSTRIDREGTDHRAGPGRTIGLRIFVFGLIASLPFLGILVALANPFFIFAGEKRQCLHDRLAGTVVRKIA